MARKFFRGETLPSTEATTVRLGVQGTPYKDVETGKFVKLGTADSQFVLCAVGDNIGAFITSVAQATSDGYSIGGIQEEDCKYAIADGSQVAGTGVLAIGDFVVCGTVVAQGTGLGNTYAKVRRSTLQPADAGFIAAYPNFWRVVSLGVAGTGAVGTQVLIEPTA